jgi:hypothetical protein
MDETKARRLGLQDVTADHRQGEGPKALYIVEALQPWRIEIERRLAQIEDVGGLFALVSDGTMTDGQKFVEIGTHEEIHAIVQTEWPPEYLRLLGRYLEANVSNHLSVMGMVHNRVHHYAIPRCAVLGEPN